MDLYKKTPHSSASIAHQRGQALLLPAVAIIGILAMGVSSFGLITLKSQLKTETVTEMRFAQVQTALAAFFVSHYRLPCPARPDLLISDPLYGIENANCANTTFGVGNAAIAMGAVPWITLGISQNSAMDTYGNFLTYYVTLSATTTGIWRGRLR